MNGDDPELSRNLGDNPANFDLHARYVFLTYSQCNLEKEYVATRLVELLGSVQYLLVGHELHEDLGDHLHVFISFGRKRRTRDVRFFDIDGFHPNIKIPIRKQECHSYCAKGGDTTTRGECPATLIPPAKRVSKRTALFRELHESSDTVEDFMSALLERDPYEFYTRGHTIRKNALSVKRLRRSAEQPYTQDQFNLPAEIQNWVDSEFAQEVRGRAPCRRFTWGDSLSWGHYS